MEPKFGIDYTVLIAQSTCLPGSVRTQKFLVDSLTLTPTLNFVAAQCLVHGKVLNRDNFLFWFRWIFSLIYRIIVLIGKKSIFLCNTYTVKLPFHHVLQPCKV